MNAITYIQRHGVEKAREVVVGAPPKDDRVWYFFICHECGCGGSSERLVTDSYICDYAACPDCGAEDFDDDWGIYDDLKRVVESLDLVAEYSGITMAKRLCECFTNACTSVGVKPSPRLSALKQAIEDYEEIYFKIGDLVVCTDDDLEAKYLTVKKITGFIDDWGLELNDGEHWVNTYRFRRATAEEETAGHRIEQVSNYER